METDIMINSAFILICTALVMLMALGVGFFYGGLVRKKNLISMLTLSFVSVALVSIQWVVCGYSLAFGPDIGGIIGNLDYCMLQGVEMSGDPVPDMLFMMFQLSFAAITLAIITSAVAERIKLSSFIIFGLLWTTFIYDPLAHWVWGGGWAQTLGVLDFAGGIVVHIGAGFAALALALVIGARLGFGEHNLEPHNIPLTLLGGALLWFGWFGFNAGSALAVNEVAINAFVVTNISAAAGALSWMFAAWVHGKPSSLSMISGAIAGLVRSLLPQDLWDRLRRYASAPFPESCVTGRFCSDLNTTGMNRWMHGRSTVLAAYGVRSPSGYLLSLPSAESAASSPAGIPRLFFS